MTAPARILLVDDEPGLLDSLREYLSNRGHHVETALNGEAALAAIARARPDGDLDGRANRRNLKFYCRFPQLLDAASTYGAAIADESSCFAVHSG